MRIWILELWGHVYKKKCSRVVGELLACFYATVDVPLSKAPSNTPTTVCVPLSL